MLKLHYAALVAFLVSLLIVFVVYSYYFLDGGSIYTWLMIVFAIANLISLCAQLLIVCILHNLAKRSAVKNDLSLS